MTDVVMILESLQGFNEALTYQPFVYVAPNEEKDCKKEKENYHRRYTMKEILKTELIWHSILYILVFVSIHFRKNMVEKNEADMSIMMWYID